MTPQPFRLVPENFTDEELFEEQPAMPQDQPNDQYRPEALPGLEGLEQFGATIAEMARQMKTSGQMIVQDLRRQRLALDREADILEQERQAEIAAINRSYMNKMDRNNIMAIEVEAMIAHYTGAVTEQPPQPMQQIEPPKRRKLLGGILG